jgi:hypothetical protein
MDFWICIEFGSQFVLMLLDYKTLKGIIKFLGYVYIKNFLIGLDNYSLFKVRTPSQK